MRFPQVSCSITERLPSLRPGSGFTAGLTREYKDGRVVASGSREAIASRAAPSKTLLYSREEKNVERAGDGRRRHFDPAAIRTASPR